MTIRTIAVVSAGLGRPSSTRMLADRLAQATTAELAERGVRAEVLTYELRDLAHGITDAMLTGFPTGDLREALEAVTGADGVIAVTPIFTTSYSGLFKSFVDVIDKDALTDVPVLIGATGGTPRHSLATEYAIRPLFTYLHADPVTTAVFAATDDWAGEADEVNPLPGRIRRAGRELAEKIAARPAREAAGDEFSDVPDFAQLLGRN